MNLEQIYQPITDELKSVETLLVSSISESKNPSILEMSNSLLESPGKRMRPALVILSGKAASVGGNGSSNYDELIRIATAVELIHMASLIHDDVLDKATMRHNRPSTNARWGDDISIVLGDYVYSKAFELIGKCRNPDIFACISEAIYVMCEGELTQVCQRDNWDLSRESYIVIIKKKTASLFAAACQAGTITCNHGPDIQSALKGFGLNFGIAFQIMDDCKDITSEQTVLGKRPGQDVIVGDMTLPLLNMLDLVRSRQKEELKTMVENQIDETNVQTIRQMVIDSNALYKTQEAIASYINCAKEQLDILNDSEYKKSLSRLADYITQKTF